MDPDLITIGPPPGWERARDALLFGVSSTFSRTKLTMLTFPEINGNARVASRHRQAIDSWQRSWRLLPDTADKRAGRIFLDKDGRSMDASMITSAKTAYSRSLDANVALPSDWEDTRDTLMVSLSAHYSPARLSTLTWEELEADAQVTATHRAAIDAWRPVWGKLPAGGSKMAGKVFLDEKGLFLPKSAIDRVLREKGQPRAEVATSAVVLEPSLPENRTTARDALIVALSSTYLPSRLATLRFSELDANLRVMMRHLGAVDAWRAIWNTLPDSSGKAAGLVFLNAEGLAMDEQAIGNIAANAARSGQAAGGLAR